MKALLDRLMARQGRLMAELAKDDDASRRRMMAAPVTRPVVTPQQREAQQVAIELADQRLVVGDLVGAGEALLPFEEQAVDVRVLTILARIQSASGRFDEALQLLGAAARIDSTDIKVPYFTAEVLELAGRDQEAIPHRRQVAFSTTSPDPRALISLMRTVVKAAAATGRLSRSELLMAVDALLAAPAAQPEQILDACQILYGVDATRARAIDLYSKHAPRPDGLRDVDARWLPIWRWCQEHGAPFETIDGAGRPGRRPQAATLTDVLIDESLHFVPLVSDGAVAIDGVRHRQLPLRANDPRSPLLMSGAQSCRLRLAAPRTEVGEPCVLVGGSDTHLLDLIEHVGPLATAEHFGLVEGRRIVVASQPTPRLLEVLELLGYSSPRVLLLPTDGPVLFRNLVVVGALSQGLRWVDPMLPAWFRRRLVGNSQGATANLYLSGKAADGPRVANEDEVERALVEQGFEVVVPQQLSIRDLVARFAGAACIVGASEDSLANIMFAPRGTRVVALRHALTSRARGGRLVEALAAACGHAFFGLDCRPVMLEPGRRLLDAEVVVDIPTLLAHVERPPEIASATA